MADPVSTPSLPHEGTATTHAEGGHLSPYSPASPEFWVYAGLTIFILLAIFVAKAPKRIADILDARIAETKRQLDEARTLRTEAEGLLREAEAKARASEADAATILKHAEHEAELIVRQAETRATELADRRARMAEDKIAAAERAALAEVRARAATLATGIAGQVLAHTHDAAADKPLVDGAISRV